MPGKIFINYRRGDDPGYSGRLFDRLESHFPQGSIFMDVDSIAPGLDFLKVLDDQVGGCDIFLAVVGQGWIGASDETGRRRLDDPNDFVRIEIESALKRDIRVIPVLVNNAEMPRSDQLPPAMKPFSTRNAVRLTHDRFKADSAGLIKAVEEAIKDEETKRADATRLKQEEAQRIAGIAQKKDEERERQEKEHVRLQAIAGLSPEQIEKAEELANWDFIKGSKRPQDFRDHLARFADGVTQNMARATLEAIEWTSINAESDVESLQRFIDEFPDGENIRGARDLLATMQSASDKKQREEMLKRKETDAWADASSIDTEDAYNEFVRMWPKSVHVRAARSHVRKLKSLKYVPGSWPRIASIWFCIAVTIAAAGVLFVFGQGAWVAPNHVLVRWLDLDLRDSGFWLSLIAVFGTTALVVWRRNSMSEMEIALYWLAAALLILVEQPFAWVTYRGWYLLGLGDSATAPNLLYAPAFVGATALALLWWRRRQLGAEEIAVYWLGISGAIVLAVSAISAATIELFHAGLIWGSRVVFSMAVIVMLW